MDALTRVQQPVRVLLELRAALDRHSGIPQQTRLLFRGLATLDDVCVEGLIQSSTHALGRGLPARKGRGRALPKDVEINRLARIVIMLEQRFRRSSVSVVPMMLRRLTGQAEALDRFEPKLYRDFIWRRLFARSLPAADLDLVTRSNFRVARTPWTAMHIGALITKSFGFAVFPRLDTRDFDVVIAETPYPGRVSRRTRLVIRYHDAVPLLMPHTIKDRRLHQGFHYRALRNNVKSGAWFACVSDVTRRDLLSVFPQAERRCTTIHNVVSGEFFDEPSSSGKVAEILRSRLNAGAHGSSSDQVRGTLPPQKCLMYVLMVSTVEPRKNHLVLLSAWERLRAEGYADLKLVVVGSLGWHHDSIISKFRPWMQRGEALFLEEVPTPELRTLYKHASATICPSVAEGFDLSGVESMASGGAVVASDIPVHREIYDDAAEYFNPYSADELVQGIRRVIDPSAPERHRGLVSRGAEVARRYSYDAIIPKWKEFLSREAAEGGG